MRKNLRRSVVEWRASSPASAVASRAADGSARMDVVLIVTGERKSPGAGRPAKAGGDARHSFVASLLTLVVLLFASSLHAASPTLSDLPLVEVPAKITTRGDTFVVFVSGDGGWANLDKTIAATLSSRGIPVVGVNALQYFWKARTPESASADLARIIRYYSAAWRKPNVYLAGYSRGADVLPFMASRLPRDLQQRVSGMTILAPSPIVEFEFHVADWLRDPAKGLPVGPEVEKLRGRRLLCVFGSEESDSLCRMLPKGLTANVAIPGSHHFDGAYEKLGGMIAEQVAGTH